MIPLLEVTFIVDSFARFHYLAPFVFLLLCGVGLPMPEEVALIGSGILVARGEADFTTISLVCAAAILIGDSAPYWVGWRYGPAALRIPWIKRVLHPERFSILEQRFAKHGNWAVFSCRFLPGLRLPGYFTAGTLRMGYGRFLLLDTLGVLLSVPTSIWLGTLFADSVGVLEERFENLHVILAFGLFCLLSFAFVRTRSRRRSLQAKELADQAHQADQAKPSEGPRAENPAPREAAETIEPPAECAPQEDGQSRTAALPTRIGAGNSLGTESER